MSSNGRIRLAIPPGYVDARCLVCPADVIIPDGTLRCPNGDHDVEPTSLPRMPRPASGNGATPLPAELMPAPTALTLQGERKPLPAPAEVVVRQPEPAPKDVEPVVLPDTAVDWHADTVALHAQLVADEARLVEQLRRTRQTRKLLDAVLDRVMAPELPPSPVVEEIVPELVAEPLAPGEKPWSTFARRCVNPACGTTERPHGAKGRCQRCYMYWRAHGTDRPADLPQRGGIHTHG